MEYRRINAVLPALGKMNPWWLWFGEHRDLRKRVLESSRLRDTIRAIDSECYCPDGEPKDSVDQDGKRLLLCHGRADDGGDDRAVFGSSIRTEPER
jgi:hypothetical protein